MNKPVFPADGLHRTQFHPRLNPVDRHGAQKL